MGQRSSKVRHFDRAELHVRVVFPHGAVFGPGRAQLLEGIRDLGTISAAARAMGMSYRRAWLLVDATSREFGAPVVAGTPGGAQGGAARLTELGERVVALYRRVESKAAEATTEEIDGLRALAATGRANAGVFVTGEMRRENEAAVC